MDMFSFRECPDISCYDAPAKIRRQIIATIQKAIGATEESNRNYCKQEVANGRRPEDSIVTQVNQVYWYLLRQWLESEEILALETKVRKLERDQIRSGQVRARRSQMHLKRML
jgi:hypothetical protein